MITSSRPELSPVVKVGDTHRTKYQPQQMTDETVYEKARHFYTLEEIATAFNVTGATVLALHGDAFRKGKDEHLAKPRIMHHHVLSQMENLDWSDPKIIASCGPMFTKLVEMQWKKMEKYGQVVEVINKEERPSASDIKFSPFKKEE